ncbi:carbohydrate porin [Salinisphaera aquimarina]|uniref:Carbohydrate porin n=1 Tax=Salinisphaera aquimarina TaxID=2094031 RepID=A0ABV7ESW5_9GAMM
MHRKYVSVLGLLLAAGAAHAQQGVEAQTGGQEVVEDSKAAISGALIGTYQDTSQDRVAGQTVDNEANAQLYLFGSHAIGPGTFNIEVRAGTTPRNNGVTSVYGEVNDTVGETLDTHGDGRIAATQIYYNLAVGPGELTVGLIDSSGLLDANEIADDEYSQFLGTSFVNNPAIDYPTFVLGADYRAALSEHLGYQVFVGSSGGLEDEDDPTYGNVFDVGESGKGDFSAAELDWHVADLYGDVGVWHNGRDHASLTHPNDDDRDSYGAYTTVGGDVGAGQWVAWAGIANDRISEAANFLALAYSREFDDVTLGAGISRIGVSDERPEPSDSIEQAEIYARFKVAEELYLSPDIQYVNNSGFDPALDDVLVAGLRAGVEF